LGKKMLPPLFTIPSAARVDWLALTTGGESGVRDY